MTQKLDYSREEAMQILNSESYSDDQKRKMYDQYMNELKKNRKSAIVSKLNEYAKDIPVITKEIYIEKLKEYETDDLSKPFEVIQLELSNFEKDMKNKYNEYLKSKEEANIVPDITPEEKEEAFDDTIFSAPIVETPVEEPVIEEEEEVKPSLLITGEMSVINEEVDKTAKALFDADDENTKEVMPDENESERGNASAIILSIIAVIIGIVVMFTIIKMN